MQFLSMQMPINPCFLSKQWVKQKSKCFQTHPSNITKTHTVNIIPNLFLIIPIQALTQKSEEEKSLNQEAQLTRKKLEIANWRGT